MKARSRTKLAHGVGRNDADYPVTITEFIEGVRRIIWICPIYQVWRDMLKRCYSEKYQSSKPTYIGCTVSPQWHSFMAFRAWMVAQDYEGKHLDKDILIHGNKEYGEDSCIFITSQLNTFMNDCGALRGQWPIGVCWDKSRGKFQAECRNPFSDSREQLGRFDCPDDAHEAWRKRKHQHACRYADMQTDPRIALALRSRYA